MQSHVLLSVYMSVSHVFVVPASQYHPRIASDQPLISANNFYLRLARIMSHQSDLAGFWG